MPPTKKEKLLKKCPDCDYSSYHVSKFLEHRRVHTGTKPYRCHVCGKECTQKSNLKTHLMIHGEGYQSEFECKLCGFKTKYKQSFLIHERHHNGEKPYKCSFCNVSFSQSTHCLTHMRETHGNIRKFSCEVCDKSFKRRDHLERHLQFHQENRDYVCNICGGAFKDERYLDVHKRIHQGEAGKVFKCSKCPYKACFKSSLETHSRLHTGERPYKCDSCNKSFVTSGSLKIHVRMVHGGTEKKSVNCTVCNQTISSKRLLKQHMHKRHPQHGDSKAYKCAVCDTMYGCEASLNKHTRTAHPEQRKRVSDVTAAATPAAGNKKSRLKRRNKRKASTDDEIEKEAIINGKNPKLIASESEGSEEEFVDESIAQAALVAKQQPRRSLRRHAKPSDDDDDYRDMNISDSTVSNGLRKDEAIPEKKKERESEEETAVDKASAKTIVEADSTSPTPETENQTCTERTKPDSEAPAEPEDDGTSLLREKLAEQKKKWTCDFCPQVFESRWRCYRHKIGQHMELYKSQQQPPKSPGRQVAPVRCTKCDLTFTSKKLLAAHAKGVHANKNFKCPTCARGFAARSSLQNHVICCRRKLQRRNRLEEQVADMRTKLQTQDSAMATGAETFACDFCERKYVSLRGVTEHKKRCHTNSNQSDRAGKYKCQYCELFYTTLHSLGRHLTLAHPDRYEEYTLARIHREHQLLVTCSAEPSARSAAYPLGIELNLDVKVEPQEEEEEETKPDISGVDGLEEDIAEGKLQVISSTTTEIDVTSEPSQREVGTVESCPGSDVKIEPDIFKNMIIVTPTGV